MWVYIVRRLMLTPFLVIAVLFITFALVHVAPGDPVEILMGKYNDPDVVDRIRYQQGLDKPFLEQFGIYLKNALRGDLGESFKHGQSTVQELIPRKIWISAQLGIAAMIIALGLGIPLGFFAALKQGTWLDTATVSACLLFMSVPVFLTAPGLLIIFSLWLGILPSNGWGGFFDTHIILPAVVLGVPGIAALARLTRASTLEVLAQDYVRTARAKGLREFTVGKRHVLRNALIPLLTVLGLSLATLLEGSIITEYIFGIPGAGQLAITSVFDRDYPVIMALGLTVAVSFIIANLIVDIAYRFVDPRIRY